MWLRRLFVVLIVVEVVLVVDYFSARALPHDLAYARAVHLAFTNPTPENLQREQQASARMQRRIVRRIWMERGVLACNSLALVFVLWQLRRAASRSSAALP